MSALDKKYDEPEKPVVLTLEEVTEQLTAQNDRWAKRRLTSAISWACIVLLAAACLFLASKIQPKAPPVIHPNTTDSLRAEVAALDSTFAYLKAHTDTTGLGDVRERLGTLTTMVETLHGRYDKLQIDLNRHEINTPH